MWRPRRAVRGEDVSANTKIEWTDTTWNPTRGCSLVSEGCRNCYAMKMAHRFNVPGRPYEGLTELGKHGPTWTGEVRLVPEVLDQPLRWRKPRRIFVNSMSDLFHHAVRSVDILRIFEIMERTKRHTFQILTKRPKLALAFCQQYGIGDANEWPSNVWLGVSVEDQKTADERIPLLLQTPAAVRFVSAEPLLGPVDVCKLGDWFCERCDDYLSASRVTFDETCDTCGDAVTWRGALDWAIVGGESGPGARPMHPDWARSIRDQCQAAGVAFHFKQWGEWLTVDVGVAANDGKWHCTTHSWGDDWLALRVGKKAAGRVLDGRTWDEFPVTSGSLRG